MEQEQSQYAPQTAEQKEYKAAKERFRAAIKEIANQQPLVKAQRKTMHFRGGERKMSPSQAAGTVHLNAIDLRHLHIAYALFCGKVIPEVNYTTTLVGPDRNNKIVRKDGKAIQHHEGAPSMDYITKLLQEYGSKTVHLS